MRKKKTLHCNYIFFEGKTRSDNKRKKHVVIKPTGGYLAKAVREFYPDLGKIKYDDPNFCKAVNLATRCYTEIEQLRDPSTCAPAKKGQLVEAASPKLQNEGSTFFHGLLMSENR